MNMPCLTKAAYYKQVENILEALENEANEEIRNAGERLRQDIWMKTLKKMSRIYWTLLLALIAHGPNN